MPQLWDFDFQLDIFSNKLPLEMITIIPIGSRGKNKLNIPPNSLVIPRFNKKISGSGRGRQLQTSKDLPDIKEPRNLSCMEEYAKAESGNKLNMTSESEYPSLKSTSRLSSTTSTQKTDLSSPQRKKKVSKSSGPFSKEIKNEKLNLLNLSNVSSKISEIKNNEKVKENKDVLLKEEKQQIDVSLKEINDHNNYQIHSNEFKLTFKEVSFHSETSLKKYNNAEYACTSLKQVGSEIHNIKKSLLKEVVNLKSDIYINNYSSTQEYINQFQTTKNDILSIDFLKSLPNPEFYVLIENLSKNIDEDNFKQDINVFGEAESFIFQQLNETEKAALIKMNEMNDCDLVISGLDGSINEDKKRTSVRKVVDILNV